jgi:hypothetical protein
VLKSIFAALAAFAIVASSLGATPAKSKKKRHPIATTSPTPAHKHAVASKSSKATSSKSTTSKTASSKTAKTGAHRKGKIARTPPRSYQQAPTLDRYREIQQALASKGYFQGEPSGQWSADSSEALKRFQADQNLMPDGKINSLSLIALGLGPKRLTAKSDSAPPPAPPAVAPAPTAPPQ